MAKDKPSTSFVFMDRSPAGGDCITSFWDEDGTDEGSGARAAELHRNVIVMSCSCQKSQPDDPPATYTADSG
jgi:hypothetical protein